MANMDRVFDFMFTNPLDSNGKPLVVEASDDLLFFADVCAGPGGFSEYVLWRKQWQSHGFGFTLEGKDDFKLHNFQAGPPEAFEPFHGMYLKYDYFHCVLSYNGFFMLMQVPKIWIVSTTRITSLHSQIMSIKIRRKMGRQVSISWWQTGWVNYGVCNYGYLEGMSLLYGQPRSFPEAKSYICFSPAVYRTFYHIWRDCARHWPRTIVCHLFDRLYLMRVRVLSDRFKVVLRWRFLFLVGNTDAKRFAHLSVHVISWNHPGFVYYWFLSVTNLFADESQFKFWYFSHLVIWNNMFLEVWFLTACVLRWYHFQNQSRM